MMIHKICRLELVAERFELSTSPTNQNLMTCPKLKRIRKLCGPVKQTAHCPLPPRVLLNKKSQCLVVKLETSSKTAEKEIAAQEAVVFDDNGNNKNGDDNKISDDFRSV